MRMPLAPSSQKHRFAWATLAGALWRLAAAWGGLGLWNVGHDHLHVLKLAHPQAPGVQASISAIDPSTTFGDGLLRPLMRGVVGLLQWAHLGTPEDLVLAVGILAVVLRLCVMLGLWRLGRGYFGASRLGHPAWIGLGLLQGALAVVSVGGVLALGQTPQAQVMVALREDTQARAVVAIGSPLEPYFLDGRVLPLAQHPALDENWLRQTLIGFERASTAANRFVFFSKDRDKSEVMLILEGLSCPEPAEYRGGWLDRLALVLDPIRHQSRGALLVYRCSDTTDVARLERRGPPARTVMRASEH